jgi:hypothetical protein
VWREKKEDILSGLMHKLELPFHFTDPKNIGTVEVFEQDIEDISLRVQIAHVSKVNNILLYIQNMV